MNCLFAVALWRAIHALYNLGMNHTQPVRKRVLSSPRLQRRKAHPPEHKDTLHINTRKHFTFFYKSTL
jgi:hypothetical protein